MEELFDLVRRDHLGLRLRSCDVKSLGFVARDRSKRVTSKTLSRRLHKRTSSNNKNNNNIYLHYFTLSLNVSELLTQLKEKSEENSIKGKVWCDLHGLSQISLPKNKEQLKPLIRIIPHGKKKVGRPGNMQELWVSRITFLLFRFGINRKPSMERPQFVFVRMSNLGADAEFFKNNLRIFTLKCS